MQSNQIREAVSCSVLASASVFICLIVTRARSNSAFFDPFYKFVEYGFTVYTLALLVIYGLIISIVPALCMFITSKIFLQKLGKENWFTELVLYTLALALGVSWAFFCFYVNI